MQKPGTSIRGKLSRCLSCPVLQRNLKLPGPKCMAAATAMSLGGGRANLRAWHLAGPTPHLRKPAVCSLLDEFLLAMPSAPPFLVGDVASLVCREHLQRSARSCISASNSAGIDDDLSTVAIGSSQLILPEIEASQPSAMPTAGFPPPCMPPPPAPW